MIKAKILAAVLAQSALLSLPLASSGALPAPTHDSWKRVLSRKVEGFISEVSVSADGKAILVAQVPDREAEIALSKPRVSRFNSEGKRLWTYTTKPVRAQTLSDDGSLALLSTHEDRLVALNARGKEIWSVDATCKPFILSGPKKILCYHDEDAESDVAFDVYDWKGKKLLSFPVSNDVLVLKLSPDRRNIVIGLTRGQIILLGPDFHALWHRQVAGEIVDVAVSSGLQPEIGVLYDRPRKKEKDLGQVLVLYDDKGHPLYETFPASRMEQLALSSQGDKALLYGNNPGGQILALHQPPKAAPRWSRSAEPFANHSSMLMATRQYAIVGFDDVTDVLRHSHIHILDFDGNLHWDIPLQTAGGGYLYVHDFSEKGKLLAVGMDDGTLNLYRLK